MKKMYLFEEYLQRHKIETPIIKHVEKGYVFFKNSSPAGIEWLQLQISWVEPTHHPGNYIVKLVRPIRDGYQGKRYFEVIKNYTFQWDEYEDAVWDIIKSLKSDKVIVGQKNIALVAWEMFFHTHDSYWTNDYIQRFDAILDFDLPVDQRYHAYTQAIDYMQNNNHDIFGNWKAGFMEGIKQYSHWLAELVKSHGTK